LGDAAGREPFVPDFSIEFPDEPQDHRDPRHSSAVATALTAAYILIKRGNVPAAFALIEPYLTWPMADTQRVRLLYVRAMHAVYSRDLLAAIAFLDEALTLALRLGYRDACVPLAYLNASIHYELHSLTSAADYYRLAFDAIRAATTIRDQRQDAALKLEILARLATMYFYLGRFTEAMRALNHARVAAQSAPDSILRRASLEWTTALVLRWRGRAYEALPHAEVALTTYQQLGHPAEQARLHSVVADIELDIAVAQADLARDSLHLMLTLARGQVTDALGKSQLARDMGARGLALLNYARLNRLTKPDESGAPAIENVIEIAQRMGDPSLLGQAYTALADDLAAHGEHSSSLKVYSLALDVFKTTDAKALAAWPRRALLRASEMATGD
jgi:tetratricopeptide (TPR) repeat protein